MRVLWSLNLFERFDDLRAQAAILRHDLGSRAEIVAVSNCRRDKLEELASCGQDRHVWIGENVGHHNGCRDAFNGLVPHVDGYDVVIQQHAKSWLTSPSSYLTVVSRMIESGASAVFLDFGKFGSMGTSQYPGEWLDVFAMTPAGYKTVFPYHHDIDKPDGLWNECHVHERSKPLTVTRLPCVELPAHMGDVARKRFVGIAGDRKSDLLSYYDVGEKLQLLRAMSPEMADVAQKAIGR